MESRVIYALGYETELYCMCHWIWNIKESQYMKVIQSVNKDNPMRYSSSG